MHRYLMTRIVAGLMLGCLLAGCGGSPRSKSARKGNKPQATKNARPEKSARDSRNPSTRPSGSGRQDPRNRTDPSRTPAKSPETATRPTDRPPEDRPPEDRPRRPRHQGPPTLADLMDQQMAAPSKWISDLPQRQIDDARAAAAGIRKLTGKRLTLYTDMPAAEEIEQLPAIFDQAFGQWCQYFNVDPAEKADWKMTGFLMKDKARFQETGLLPKSLPHFPHGFARNNELWLYDQPSDYYRRHLLLHEGTHGFMITVLGGCGPPWYMEGIAELLSTHRWHEGRLTMNYLPAHRDEVPYWGRMRIIQDAYAENRALTLHRILGYAPDAHQETEPYGWCWGAATLLDRHPRYRQRFRQLYKNVLKPDFNERFLKLMEADWRPLEEEWQLFVVGIEYGYDVAATAVDFAPGKPLPLSGSSVKVAAAKGWQNSGLRLEAGVTYRLRASGRYQVAQVPRTWWCEPGGVSIRYYQHAPLGILLAAVRSDNPVLGSISGLVQPAIVGLGNTLVPKETGTLYLRINDSAAELDDNAGELTVKIVRE